MLTNFLQYTYRFITLQITGCECLITLCILLLPTTGYKYHISSLDDALSKRSIPSPLPVSTANIITFPYLSPRPSETKPFIERN